MNYINVTFGATNQYTAKIPENDRLYVFSPYYVEVTGTAANQLVTVSTYLNSIKRRTNSDFKCKFPISELFQVFFKGLEIGDVADHIVGQFYNAGSKLALTSYELDIKVGTDTNVLNISRYPVFGAMQLGEVEETSVEIYVYRKYVGETETYLPCTLTNNIQYTGWDFWVSDFVASGYNWNYPWQIRDGETVLREYYFKVITYCGDDNTYLRWVAPTGEYKYFLFKPYYETDDIQSNPIAKQQIWGLDQTSDGMFGHIKTDERNKNRNINPIIECGVPNASYNQQLHLRTLERSLMQWYWNGTTWVECRIEMDAVEIDRFKDPKEITVRVIKPKLYIQTL